MITLIPTTSSLSSPQQFRRSQDFSVASIIEFNCNISFPITTKWTIKNCSSNCSYQFNLNGILDTTQSELYIPGRTLPYGLYELKLIVTRVNPPSLTISSSA